MSGEAVGQGLLLRVEDLGGAQAGQLGTQQARDVSTVELGGGKLTGGDVDIGNASLLLLLNNRAKVVVALSGEQSRLDQGAGGDHTHHLARENSFDRLVTDLLADGDMVALLDQAGEVVFGGVMGNAGHGNAGALGDGAGGEEEIQLTGSGFGILVEGLVKIAEAKEEDGVGILALDLEILFADGGDVVVWGHRGYGIHSILR